MRPWSRASVRALACAALVAASSASWAGPAGGRLTILGGPTAGIFNVFATGLATFLSRNVPGVEVTVAATGGSVENVRRVNAGDAEMAVAFASDVHEGYHGVEAFQGNPQRNIRAIGLLFVGVGHLVTYKDSGIRTVADLAGKRVAVGSPGSGTFANAQRIFGELGLWDRLQRVPLLGSAAAAGTVLCFVPTLETDLAGIGLFVLVYLWQRHKLRTRPDLAPRRATVAARPAVE